MSRQGINAVVITSQDNFEYYSGFLTAGWTMNTRPYFAIVREDKPGVTIIVARGDGNRRFKFVDRLEYAGYTIDGIKAVGNFLSYLPAGSKIGLDYGADLCGRGSVALINFLQGSPRNFQLSDSADLIWLQRMIKSEHEIENKRAACKIATDGFFQRLGDLRRGISEYEFGQLLKQHMIGLGADSVDWLPVRFGLGREDVPGTYVSRNSDPVVRNDLNSDRKLQEHDFVWVDIGARRADQISDVNRVAKIGKAMPEQEACYAAVRGVTQRVIEGIRPGMTGGDAFALFERVWSSSDASKFGAISTFLASAGRVGHGSGVGLTEPPSIQAGNEEVIEEDMVMHVEPKLFVLGGVFQTEEIFRVTPRGPDFLTDVAPPKLPIVEF